MKNILAILLLSFTLLSCSKNTKDTKQEHEENITLSFICQDTGNSSPHRGRLAFAEKLAQISGGNMKVEFIYLTKNSSSSEMFGMISSGYFDITATPFSDIANIIENGEVEAQENPLNIIEAAKLYKVQKYLAITDHLLTIVPMIINKYKYESFSDKQKEWFAEAIERGNKTCANLVLSQEVTLIDKFEKEYNMQVTYPNQRELKEAMKDYYDEVKEKFGKYLIEEISML